MKDAPTITTFESLDKALKMVFASAIVRSVNIFWSSDPG